MYAAADKIFWAKKNCRIRRCIIYTITVKPVLRGHSKTDKTKVLKTDYHLMQDKSIAECSKGEHSAILLTCIKR